MTGFGWVKSLNYFELIISGGTDDYDFKSYTYMYYGAKTKEQWAKDVNEVMVKYLDEYMIICPTAGAGGVTLSGWVSYIDKMRYLCEKGYVKLVVDGVYDINESILDYEYILDNYGIKLFGAEAIQKIRTFNGF